jgi:hypothetical protein
MSIVYHLVVGFGGLGGVQSSMVLHGARFKLQALGNLSFSISNTREKKGRGGMGILDG